MSDILLGVAGKPIFHSKSPLIFNSIFSAKNLHAVYFRILCSNEQNLFSILKSLDMKGANATSPLKEMIFSNLDNCDRFAVKSRSVNCIKNHNKKLTGFSTDHYGVITPLSRMIDLKDRKIAVIGAGGAARAAVSGLSEYTKSITVLNRTLSKAQDIASEFGCDAADLKCAADVFPNCEVLISTLPSGIDIPFIDSINKNAVLFDANYKHSMLEQFAEQSKMKFISGENWLINQASPAYEIFMDDNPGTIQADISKDVIYSKNVIILTGFMCSGKTAAGMELAEKLGYEFADMDAIIESGEECSINEIFRKYGEKYFRERESDLLAELCNKNQIVISTGGGIVLSDENRNILNNHLTIWIYSDIETSISRDNGTRPLLDTVGKTEKAKELFEKRKFYYASSCSFMAYNCSDVETLVKELYDEISCI